MINNKLYNSWKTYKPLITKNYLSPLSSIPFHSEVECIDRYFSEEFPLHLAIHRINNAQEKKRSYTKLHSHNVHEINIIIADPGETLEYEIIIGQETHHVKSNSSIFIPSQVKHSSNVICGSGYYIALRLEENNSNELTFLKHLIIPNLQRKDFS